MPDPRVLSAADIAGAMRLKEAAGWNQTETDWRNLLRLEPEGCFGIECGGALAATTTAVRYGADLAWIGMVLTHPDWRGRGFARSLMHHALACLDARGVRTIKLDATDMGRPLYLELGFADEQPVERWLRPPGAAPADATGTWNAAEFAALDRAAFGADRLALLETLAPLGAAAIGKDGYAMGRPGSKADYFGPCVCGSAETARALLEWFLAGHPGESVFWDLLPANRAAANLARALGFSPVRRLTRMSRRAQSARDLPRSDEMIFAIAGFEYG